MISPNLLRIHTKIRDIDLHKVEKINIDIYYMKEENSGFENIMNEMSTSQTAFNKIRVTKCDNPNCKNAFSIFDKCLSCNKTYCNECLTNCENCDSQTCKFCITIQYSKSKDIAKCPMC